MWIWYALVAISVAVSALFSQQENQLTAADNHFYNNQAAAIQAYRDSVGRYLKTAPTLEGDVDDYTAGIPSWFIKPPGLMATATAGVGYIYLPAPPAALYSALVTYTNGSTQIGIASSSGTLNQPHISTAATTAIPSSIPPNALVYIVRTSK